jgi:hypothetical protein
MGVIHEARIHGLTIRESAADGSDFSDPDPGYRRLFLGDDGQLHVKDAGGEVTGIGGVEDILWLPTAETDTGLRLAPDGAGGVGFVASATSKHVVRIGGGTLSTTSATKTPIDATELGYLSLELAEGDVVRCTLCGLMGENTGLAGIDFEVEQPTSAATYVAAGADMGVTACRAAERTSITAVGLFTATEAGSHGFRPVWVVEPGGSTGKLCNASSGVEGAAITFIVEKLGTPA